MKKTYKILTFLAITSALFSGCHDDLNQDPTIDPDSFTEQNVFANADEAKGALAKLYASLALTGQEGPAGQADITGIDEGTSQYSRMLFNLNELTTDNAVVGWGDPGLPNLHEMNWDSSNDFTAAMYYRLAQEVSFCNSFIENAESLAEDTEVQYFIAEARFLRAFAYYNLIDLYGNVPLVTLVSTELPEQSNRTEIFQYVESELLEIQDLLKESQANEYGRVDRVAAWALLSKLYLNAEVWTGENKYTEAVTYSEKAIVSSYSINTNDANGNGSAYDELFLADNNANGAQNEFIFAINFDGNQSRTYGGTTFLVHAAIGGDMDPSLFGVNGGWGGNRTTSALVEKFDDAATTFNDDGFPTAWEDTRALFYTDGQSYEINTIANTFTDGYAITKFKNVTSEGNPGSDAGGDFVDTDLPLIRLAEIYLNYAEAVLRGGSGGNVNTAVSYINQLRTRAYGNTNGNIASGDLTLSFVLNERARELYWEGQRRTDLIRYNLFTTASYVWPFKGGVKNGAAVDSYRNLFPLPANIISINTNLTQNPGY
ncbi:RagB/SusD family nutrient uptake outer membrane protein [Galbibacter pacificus]|uniref:RagB/SusD family nutrient uptake outer membrane protein n=1 Tax=Galbibacter pacificus TaxID=2996052 RepID=A0ABT6FWB7_9FLAO|nr:RagB/SusD family nutrient uptake outer membrane protein [Galbibacter pacificus]MDG3583995.1 RagB/SusD family nutrient uptake outer membrane protein [Galbibacter pacificus]MDG3587568.1 RagB/SusD family nutrient uptake outer membrane protein [Galbibacter pacificus]